MGHNVCFKCYDRLWPDYASALNNLAALTVNTTEAESLYREVVRIQPCHANAHFSLGNLLRYVWNIVCQYSIGYRLLVST